MKIKAPDLKTFVGFITDDRGSLRHKSMIAYLTESQAEADYNLYNYISPRCRHVSWSDDCDHDWPYWGQRHPKVAVEWVELPASRFPKSVDELASLKLTQKAIIL